MNDILERFDIWQRLWETLNAGKMCVWNIEVSKSFSLRTFSPVFWNLLILPLISQLTGRPYRSLAYGSKVNCGLSLKLCYFMPMRCCLSRLPFQRNKNLINGPHGRPLWFKSLLFGAFLTLAWISGINFQPGMTARLIHSLISISTAPGNLAAPICYQLQGVSQIDKCCVWFLKC